MNAQLSNIQHDSRAGFDGFGPTCLCRLLSKHLGSDATSLLNVLERCGDWDPQADAKLNALFALLTKQHSNDKVLVFTQFADTVRYLEAELRARGLRRIAGVTGDSERSA
jgi:superfamily II DNA or RNA helicase